ncbi:MAG TPA: LCP family protein [Desulfobacteria bacterium]|nr:LCP family protein [Desulfobacteria bacterium]
MGHGFKGLAVIVAVLGVLGILGLMYPRIPQSLPAHPLADQTENYSVPPASDTVLPSTDATASSPDNNNSLAPEPMAINSGVAQRLNILLIGVDARGKEPSRSDSMILVSLNPNTKSVVLLSVMRDTFVTIPAFKPVRHRINTAYAMGGPQLVSKTVSNFLGVPVNAYAVADFAGFAKAVDAVGGVEVDVEKDMNYHDDGVYDIRLKAGKQVLNGKQALGYVRFRHDEQGDYTRVERQRKLIKALVAKVQGIQAVYYLPKLVRAIKPYIETNLDLPTLSHIALLASFVKDVKSATVPSPYARVEGIVNGMSVLVPDVNKTRQEVKKLLQ